MDASNKIDYIETPTRNIQKTKAFFEQLFGWTFQDFGPEYIAFNDDRLAGGFYKSEVVASVALGSTLTVFYTKQLEAYEKKVPELGGTIIREIFSFPGGQALSFHRSRRQRVCDLV